MIIQVGSDYFINKFNFYGINNLNLLINPKSPYLFLAGNVGDPKCDNFWKFMYYCSINFYKVFYITGYYEYLNNDITEMDNFIINAIARYDNVFFVKNKVYHDNEITVIGSTLWKSIQPEKQTNIKLYYSKINYKNKTLNINSINLLSILNKNFIEESLKNKNFNKTFVLTSFTPDTENLYILNKAKYWIHGMKNYKLKNGIFIYSNPYVLNNEYNVIYNNSEVI